MIVLINSHSFGFNINISTNRDNYNLRNDLINNFGWNGTSAIDVNVTVHSGVLIKGTASATPAFVVNLSTGSTLSLINNGTIRGEGGAAGGAGSTGVGGVGGAGGHAISLQNVTATIDNGSGTISGAGGGGGGGGATKSAGSYDPENNPECENISYVVGAVGGKGAGGTTTSPSGNGGALGSSGGTGPTGSVFTYVNCRQFWVGGAGGAAGKAISVLSGASRTIESNGTIHGATS